MDVLNLLNRFYRKANKDPRLKPSHVSLYLSLLWVWQESGSLAYFKVYRKSLMGLAKINSIVTYHKCIKELSEHGYVTYQPSYDHYTGCSVSLTAL